MLDDGAYADLKVFEKAMRRYGMAVRDQRLACAPFGIPEGQEHVAATGYPAGTAFANPRMITHQVRGAYAMVCGWSAEELGLELVDGVAHNIAKVERHEEGKLTVHGQGLWSEQPALPHALKQRGQPVMCVDSMETGSYLFVGTERAMQGTFDPMIHGSGRTMSRAQAKKSVRGDQLQQQMKQKGIVVRLCRCPASPKKRASPTRTLPKSSRRWTDAGITKKVAELQPIGNIKG